MWGFLSLLLIIRPDYYVLSDTVIIEGWMNRFSAADPTCSLEHKKQILALNEETRGPH